MVSLNRSFIFFLIFLASFCVLLKFILYFFFFFVSSLFLYIICLVHLILECFVCRSESASFLNFFCSLIILFASFSLRVFHTLFPLFSRSIQFGSAIFACLFHTIARSFLACIWVLVNIIWCSPLISMFYLYRNMCGGILFFSAVDNFFFFFFLFLFLFLFIFYTSQYLFYGDG